MILALHTISLKTLLTMVLCTTMLLSALSAPEWYTYTI
jgi:hypothetical protein